MKKCMVIKRPHPLFKLALIIGDHTFNFANTHRWLCPASDCLNAHDILWKDWGFRVDINIIKSGFRIDLDLVR